MRKSLFFYNMLICIFAAILLSACDDNEDYEKTYGTGSPLPENIIKCGTYVYTYNDKGLVTKIAGVSDGTDEAGNKTTTQEMIVATISYPKKDKAVMYYYENGIACIVYTFAFGENHFANRVIAKEDDGETYLIKFNYDKEGHCTSIDDGEDHLKMEWTDGNLTKIQQNEYNARAELTYTIKNTFEFYGMSPFLLDVNLGPNMSSLPWWYECGLYYALHIGFLGKPCHRLPDTITSYDSLNKDPWKRHFNYWEVVVEGETPFGMWNCE